MAFGKWRHVCGGYTVLKLKMVTLVIYLLKFTVLGVNYESFGEENIYKKSPYKV